MACSQIDERRTHSVCASGEEQRLPKSLHMRASLYTTDRIGLDRTELRRWAKGKGEEGEEEEAKPGGPTNHSPAARKEHYTASRTYATMQQSLDEARLIASRPVFKRGRTASVRFRAVCRLSCQCQPPGAGRRPRCGPRPARAPLAAQRRRPGSSRGS